jgi:cytochrome c553
MRTFLAMAMIAFLLAGCNSKKDKQTGAENEGNIKITTGAFNVPEHNIPVNYDMSGNKKIDLSLEGEESTLTRQLGAIASVKNNYSKVQKELLAKRLGKNYFLKCSACHDDYANGVIGPSLLAKSSNEIFDMIKAYKTKERNNVLMHYLVSQMEDSEIRSLADEIAVFNKEVREGKNASN